jgi:hypothetical protein
MNASWTYGVGGVGRVEKRLLVKQPKEVLEKSHGRWRQLYPYRIEVRSF